MAYEWAKMAHGPNFRWHFGIAVTGLFTSLALLQFSLVNQAWAAVLVAALLVSIAARAKSIRPIWPVFGIAYVLGPCLALNWLRLDSMGLETCLWLLCTVWSTDSAAYATGSVLGGPKLAPTISPQKTWAGAIGGMVAAMACSWGFSVLCASPAPLLVIGTGLLIAVATILGDLLESQLKRHFGVKNTSQLIPGHGGVLDRLDGMIVATLLLMVLSQTLGLSPLKSALP